VRYSAVWSTALQLQPVLAGRAACVPSPAPDLEQRLARKRAPAAGHLGVVLVQRGLARVRDRALARVELAALGHLAAPVVPGLRRAALAPRRLLLAELAGSLSYRLGLARGGWLPELPPGTLAKTAEVPPFPAFLHAERLQALKNTRPSACGAQQASVRG